MKKHQTRSAERASSASGQAEDIVSIDQQKLQTSDVTFAERRTEMMTMLKRYEVDPAWLQAQQTKELRDHMNKEGEKLLK